MWDFLHDLDQISLVETSSSEDEPITTRGDPVEYLPFDVKVLVNKNFHDYQWLKTKCHSLMHFISAYERHPEKAELDADTLVE